MSRNRPFRALLPDARSITSAGINALALRSIGKIMSRSCVVAVALFLAIDLWAGDPWKEKSYEVWNEKDVRKILNESPWAKRIEVEGPQTKGAGLAAEEAATGEGAGGEEAEGAGGRSEDNERGRITLVVRWVSSRTLRQAWVRSEVLQKRIAETDTAKFLPPSSDDAELLIVGTDMSPFEKLDENALRTKSFLLRTKSKQRIEPGAVRIVRLPDGRGIKGILFHFPKKILATPSTLPIYDNDLKFVSRTGKTEIRVSFDLQQMFDHEGLDL
jgi:hypothetical protein